MKFPSRRPIVSIPSVLGGEQIIEGTRIPASLLYELIINKAYPLEVLTKEYPSLSMEKLLKFRLLIESLKTSEKKAASSTAR